MILYHVQKLLYNIALKGITELFMFGGVGKVFVDGKVVNKAGTPVSDKSVVKIMAEVPKYVCR